MTDRDEVAEKLFGDTYARLSAWGKTQVDSVMRFREVPANQPVLDNRDTLHSERLARDLESARMENLELWDENTELKAQLAELRAQFNLPDDSTS